MSTEHIIRIDTPEQWNQEERRQWQYERRKDVRERVYKWESVTHTLRRHSDYWLAATNEAFTNYRANPEVGYALYFAFKARLHTIREVLQALEEIPADEPCPCLPCEEQRREQAEAISADAVARSQEQTQGE